MNKGQFKKNDKRTIEAAKKGGKRAKELREDRFLILDKDIDQPIITQREFKKRWWRW